MVSFTVNFYQVGSGTCDFVAAVGTATATFAGPIALTSSVAAGNIETLNLSLIATVTVAGTLTLTANPNALGNGTVDRFGAVSATSPATGYVATKIG